MNPRYKSVLALFALLVATLQGWGQTAAKTPSVFSALPTWFWLLIATGSALLVYLLAKNRSASLRNSRQHLQTQIDAATSEILRQKQQIEEQKAQLEEEQEKAEKLLQNLLPQETVEELKSKGKARARHYRSATILFTDFVHFTRIAEKLRPTELVAMLDSYFVMFDEIIARHNIEKIKTMGDAYMAAGGIPIRNRSNAIDTVLAALEIQYRGKQLSAKYQAEGHPPWRLRVGIHTGELVAGVIGIKRFAYDIWGDSVNIAKRIESSGEAGRVNISGKTYQKVKDFFECTHRGKIEAKNKGEVNMYFVDRLKPQFAEDDHGIYPNARFWEYVNLKLYSSLNYTKAEKYILRRLKKELSNDLLYHSLNHTQDVCDQVERIARSEKIVGEDLFILKTAALYHDAGFISQYSKNEPLGAQLARENLPRFGYTENQVELIAELILATSVPQKPINKLQQILCDADLDYLGRDDFEEISDRLMNELIAHGKIEGRHQWDEMQVAFLSNHKYFTETNQREREPTKQEHLQHIKTRLATTSS